MKTGFRFLYQKSQFVIGTTRKKVVEGGRTFRVVRSVPEMFTVVRVDKHNAYGRYVGDEHIGICPLGLNLLGTEVTDFSVITEHRLNRRFHNFRLLLDKQMRQLNEMIKTC